MVNNLIGRQFAALDKGFVTLTDVMGSDEDIVTAARTSYGQGTKSVSDNTTLIRYLMRHRHCYDSQTEVLTEDGFVPWPKLFESGIKNPILGVYDPKVDSLVYEQAEYLTCDEYTGNMYQVEHGGVSLCVTPEHSMYVKTKKWDGQSMDWEDDYRLTRTTELQNISMVRYCKIAPLKNIPSFTGDKLPLVFDNPSDLLRMFSFFVGDGSAPSANIISFHLKKKRKINFLYELCMGLGWCVEKKANNNYYVYSVNVGKLFGELFYNANRDKVVPSFLLKLNCEDSQSLLEGFKNSDGSIKRGAWSYSSTVQQVAESVQLVALHAGEAAHYNQKSSGMWDVMILSRMREPVINQSSRNTSLQHYCGKVYCAKTRTGILVVRRNGKIVLSGNTTPFEMAELKFLIKVPMDCWRQFVRHRTASINEYSTRYSIAMDDKQQTAEWRAQSGTNKQGSSGLIEGEVNGVGTRKYLSAVEYDFHRMADQVYQERINLGVAREQARKDLPLSTYTQAYWKIDLHNLLHFLQLRMDSHAQKEIREYATIIGEKIVAPLFPITWQAFVDYRLEAMVLSRLDILNIKEALKGGLYIFGNKREAEESASKLERIGIRL